MLNNLVRGVIVVPAASYLSTLHNHRLPVVHLELLQPPFPDIRVNFIPHCRSEVYFIKSILSAQLAEYSEILQRRTGHAVVCYPMEVYDPRENLLPLETARIMADVRNISQEQTLPRVEPIRNHIQDFKIGYKRVVEPGSIHKNNVSSTLLVLESDCDNFICKRRQLVANSVGFTSSRKAYKLREYE